MKRVLLAATIILAPGGLLLGAWLLIRKARSNHHG